MSSIETAPINELINKYHRLTKYPLLHSTSDMDGKMDFKTAVSFSCINTSFNTVRRSYEEDTFLEEAAYSSGDNKVVV